MFSGWFEKSGCPIGIDFGARSIKLLQLKRVDDGFGVRAAVARSIPARLPEAGQERVKVLSGMLAETISSGGFLGRQVVSSLPATALQYKNLRMVKMPPEELKAAVEWEAADRLQINGKNMHIQFFDAGEVIQGEEQRQEIILMGAPAIVVEEHVQILSQANLQPVAIECVPSALARYINFGSDAGDAGDAQVIVDVGYSSTKVLIVRDGRVLFFKLIDIGGRDVDDRLARDLKLQSQEAGDLRRRITQGGSDSSTGQPPPPNAEEAVAEAIRATVGKLGSEIGLCLRYYSVTFRGRRPSTSTLVGGEAQSATFAKLLSEEAGIQIEPALARTGVDLTAAPLQEAGPAAWIVAAGLSMRVENRGAGRATKRGAA